MEKQEQTGFFTKLEMLEKQKWALVSMAKENDPSAFRHTWGYNEACERYYALQAAIRHLDVLLRNLTSWEKKAD